ncbi:MAG: signal peptidase I [Candidatus Andersenbacteria bacterium]
MDSIQPPQIRPTSERVITYAEFRPLQQHHSQIRLPTTSQSRVRQVVTFFLFVAVITASAGIWHTVRTTELFVVRSGSMEPVIATGAVITVKEQLAYAPGDIITFRSAKGTTTHRIIENVTTKQGLAYRTQGDANNVADSKLVPHGFVIGAADMSIPYLGYLLRWLHTKTGFTLAILLPATLVILQELAAMKQAWRQLRQPRLLLKGATAFAVLLVTVPATLAVFSDSAAITNSQFSTSAIFPSPSPTPSTEPSPSVSPSPSPEPSVSPSPSPLPAANCDLDVNIEQRNENTGPGSTNENNTEVSSECDITSTTETQISNTITVDATTGGNTAEDNTTGGTVTSGDINISVDLHNTAP